MLSGLQVADRQILRKNLEDIEIILKLREYIFLYEDFAGGQVILLGPICRRLFEAEHKDLEVDLIIFDGDGIGYYKRREPFALALEDVAEEALLLLVVGTLWGGRVALEV